MAKILEMPAQAPKRKRARQSKWKKVVLEYTIEFIFLVSAIITADLIVHML